MTTMSDEGYPASNWEHTDSEIAAHSTHPTLRVPHTQGHPYTSDESLSAAGATVPVTPSKSASPPRSSADSPTRLSSQKWRDSSLSHVEALPNDDVVVETGFDESVLRALCDLDCGVPLLLDRIKQSMASCREVSVFFKKRAVYEDDYGRNMQKLVRSTTDAYAVNDGKAGSFVKAWQDSLKLHDTIAENRLRFARRLNEMSEELSNLAKEVDKTRKQTKELSTRYERALQEAESTREKCRSRLDITTEELERLLLLKEGESVRDNGLQGRTPGGAGGKRAIGKAVAKGGMLLKGRNPISIQRQEDDIRARMSNASDAYRKAMHDSQAIRQEYFNFQLPRILRSLKECADEIDLGTQYHLTRYAFLYENAILSDGSVLVPGSEDPSLKSIFEAIDDRSDFKTFMQNYAFTHEGQNPKAPRRDGPKDDGFLPPILPITAHHHVGTPNTNHTQMSDKGRPTFGVDLAEQLARDNVEVPPIMTKCCDAIEKYGLDSQGIYRIGGMMRKVQELKDKLDRDLDSVDLGAEEWSSDVSNVTSVLKLWLRELPDPLFTYNLQPGFMEAARNENERMRHIKLHEQVNELPDANYATLRYFMGHLYKVVQHEGKNAMSIQNLAIVFGPTLFGQGQPGVNGQINDMMDTSLQNKAVETILKHYVDIFVEEPEQS